ncbi:MAG: M56 family metallopeptidase [Verrucomicrobiales bacterium]|nr:M56 family metallopeptidase [Verrucomicrobiales bacterium]
MNGIVIALAQALAVVFASGCFIALFAFLLLLGNRSAKWRYGVTLSAQLLFPVVFFTALLVLETPKPPTLPEQSPATQITNQSANPETAKEYGERTAVVVEQQREEIVTTTTSWSFAPWSKLMWQGIQNRSVSLVTIWVIGIIVFGSRLLFGWLRLKKTGRQSSPVSGEHWTQLFFALCEKSGLNRKPDLRESKEVRSPFTFGWLKPVIIIPIGFLSQIPTDQAEAILLHELAHIKRRDYLINWLQSLIETMFFFHPVVWWLGHLSRIAREECCDSFVVDQGTDATLYASALANLTSWKATDFAQAAKAGNLTDRVRRLLTREEPNAIWINPFGTVVGMAVFVAITLGLISVPKNSGGNEEEEPGAILPVREKEHSIAGTVLSPAGEPLSEATVFLYYNGPEKQLLSGIAEQTKADENGQFRFNEKLEYKDWNGGKWWDAWYVIAKHRTFAPGWMKFQSEDNPAGNEIEIQLTEGRDCEIVATEKKSGDVVAGATVWMAFTNSSEDGSESLRDRLIMTTPVPEILGGVTDENGKLVLKNAPQTGFTIRGEKEGFTHAYRSRAADKTGPWKLLFQPGATFAGQCVDPNGNPVSRVRVAIRPEHSGDRWIGETDSDGKFSFTALDGKGNNAWRGGGGNGEFEVNFLHEKLLGAPMDIQLDSGEKSTEHLIVMKPGFRLRTKITEGVTNKPLENTWVLCDTGGGRKGSATDSFGNASFLVLPGKVQVILGSPPPGKYIRNGFGFDSSWSGVVSPGYPTVKLNTGAPTGEVHPLSGKVIFPENTDKPPVNVWWGCKEHEMIEFPGSRRSGWRVATNDRGEFTFDIAPAGLPLFLYATTKSGDLAGYIATEGFQKGEEISIPLQSGKSRNLYLTNADGKPASNLSIVVEPQLGSRYSDYSRTTFQADESGKVTVNGILPDVIYKVEDKADRYSTHQLVLWKDEWNQQPDAPQELTMGSMIRIRATDAAGNSLSIKKVSDWFVQSYGARWTNGPMPIEKHHDDGSISVRRSFFALASTGGNFEGYITLTNGNRAQATGTFPGQGTLGLHLKTKIMQTSLPRVAPAPESLQAQHPLQIAGRILDENGNPFGGVNVFTGPGDYDPWTATGPDGIYKIDVKSKGRFAYLRIEAEGYAKRWIPAFQAETPVDITLSRSTRFSGVLQSAAGKPLPNVRIVLRTRRDRPPAWFGDKGLENLLVETTTAADGSYDVAVEPGDYMIEVESAGGLALWTDDYFRINKDQQIPLPGDIRKGKELTVTLVDSQTGKPVPDYEMYFHEEWAPGNIRERKGSRRKTDAAGRAEWKGLIPREIQITSPNRSPHGIQSPYVRWWKKAEPGSNNSRNTRGMEEIHIDLADSPQQILQTVEMEMGTHISGTVRPPAYYTGDPLRYSLSLKIAGGGSYGGGRFNLYCNENGEFDGWVPTVDGRGLILAAYESTNAPDRKFAMARSRVFQPKPGEKFEFDLTLEKGGALKGQLVSKEEPIPFAEVSITLRYIEGHSEPSGLLWLKPDAEGHFTFPAVSTGTCVVNARYKGDFLQILSDKAKDVRIEKGRTMDLGKILVRE